MYQSYASTDSIKKYNDYFKAVMGTERARHTCQRRLKTIEKLARGLEGKEVLDIGCGMGFRTLGIAKKGVKSVIGIDLDRDRISQAKNLVQNLSINNINFIFMNAQSLAFPDSSFDLVIADEMIHHVKNLSKVIGEVFRVTKKGGIMVISDHNKYSLFSELVRFIYFGKNREKLYSVYQIWRLFREARFREVEYKHILFTFPFSRIPHLLLKANYAIELILEKIPGLNLQCGVYVIRGIK